MNNIQAIQSDFGGANTKGYWPNSDRISHPLEAVREPLGVIINGDLTAFWQESQVTLYKKFYHRNKHDQSDKNLKLDIFPGLGNHDYENNVKDCWWREDPTLLLKGRNGCAKHATAYIKQMLNCDTVPNFPKARISSYDESSLAYSYDIGNWHFVQLHNYSSYTVPSLGITSSHDWLKQDLERAKVAGKHIVINMHQFYDDRKFRSTIKNYPVKAIFVGHLHAQLGLRDRIYSTPVYYSGAAEYNSFLLARFSDSDMTVASVSSKGGVPRFRAPGASSHLKTIQILESNK